MGSTRLPSKIMLPVLGKPLLHYMIDRIRQSKKLEKIIICTTNKTEDDVIIDFCKSENIEYFRGSENDVLNRYFETANFFSIDVIVRLTSDTPLLDPHVIDKVISIYENNKFDFVSNFFPFPRTYPEGYNVEVFSMDILTQANLEAIKPSDREHVTTYIAMQPDVFKIYRVDNEKDFSKYRLTLDYEDDYKLIKLIFESLHDQQYFFTLEDIINWLEQNPDVLKINSHIQPYQNLIRSFENDANLGFDQHKNNFYLKYK